MAKKKAKNAVNKAARRRKKKVQTPTWTMPEGITYSALSTWDECPEQFALKYIEGLTSKKLSIPLEFGSIIHYMIENQFNSSSPQEVAETVGQQYRETRRKKLTHSHDKDTLDVLLALAYVTFPQYCDYWTTDDKSLDWVSREEKFEVDYEVPFPDGTTYPLKLKGMRDGVYRNKNDLGIFETKTKSRVSPDEIINGLHSDMQTMIYVLATMLQTKEEPKEVKYNIIRRSGLTFRKNDTLQTYSDRVEEDIIKRPDFYFQRYRVTITKDDISTFMLHSFDPTLRLFIQWWESVKNDLSMEGRFHSPYHRLNSRNLIGKYGKTDMWDAIFKRRTGYFYREVAFPELNDSFQVTWPESTTLSLPT